MNRNMLEIRQKMQLIQIIHERYKLRGFCHTHAHTRVSGALVNIRYFIVNTGFNIVFPGVENTG